MKKFLLVIFILLVGFGGYVIYDSLFKDKIPVVDTEEDIIDIDNIYIYGTHLNLHGKLAINDNFQLVLYNGEDRVIEINKMQNEFNLSDKINEGLYLEDIPNGKYYLFLRSTYTDSNGEEKYKYYKLNNTTDYKETLYYTFSSSNKKITINSENDYPTLMLVVEKTQDKDVYDIVIDPGHGGMDGGANMNGYKEADLTMQIAKKLADRLKKDGVRVKLTRDEGDLTKNEMMEEYGKGGRAVISHEVNAKYLLSIHMNSNAADSVHGLEVYTASNINYDLAKTFVNNITDEAGLNYSNNKINRVFNGIYSRNFTEKEIEEEAEHKIEKELMPYDITTNSSYYYMVRETGGIMTGAYVDDRNPSILGNPYLKSNVGTETYLLELGYLSNKSDLNNMLDKMDLYVDAIAKSIETVIK